jgi:ubiquinone/menaquinone biosynthesis C-methylase UbiE
MRNTPTLRTAVKAYLRSAPPFMAIIRAQEIELFQLAKKYLTGETLDFGCGDGFFASVTFKQISTIKKLVGIDVVSNDRCDEAKAKKRYDKLVLYNGEKLPFKSKTFDTVVSNCVFEHIPNIGQSVSEIHRVLKPGGYCVTSVMTNAWDEMLLGRKIVGFWYANWMRKKQVHVSLLSKNNWKKLFEKTGFEVIEQTGYVGERCALWLDLAHYLSFPSLIWYKLTGNWTLFPELTTLPFTNLVLSIITQNEKKHAAQFFVLRKK